VLLPFKPMLTKIGPEADGQVRLPNLQDRNRYRLELERWRRALEREGKCRSGGCTAETQCEPRRDQAQRCNQPNEKDGQHRRPDAGIGAVGQGRPGLRVGTVHEKTRLTTRRMSSGTGMAGQKLQDRVRVSGRTLDAGLGARNGRHRDRRDCYPNPCAPVPGRCHRLSRVGNTTTHLTLCHRMGFA
jgi:hypothetical protein